MLCCGNELLCRCFIVWIYSLQWIQFGIIIKFFCNYLASSNNYLLKFYRWRPLVVRGWLAVRMVTTIHPPTTTTLSNGGLCSVSRELACYGGDALQYRIEYRTWRTSAPRCETQPVHHFQGFLGHEATIFKEAEEAQQTDEWSNTIE